MTKPASPALEEQVSLTQALTGAPRSQVSVLPALSLLPDDVVSSGLQVTPASGNKGQQSPSFTVSVVPKLGCSLASPGDLYKMLMPGSQILTYWVWSAAWPSGYFRSPGESNIQQRVGSLALSQGSQPGLCMRTTRERKHAHTPDLNDERLHS